MSNSRCCPKELFSARYLLCKMAELNLINTETYKKMNESIKALERDDDYESHDEE